MERNGSSAPDKGRGTDARALSRLSPSSEALRLVPYEAARRLQILPLRIDETGRLVAFSLHAGDMFLADEVRALCRQPVTLVQAAEASLSAEIERAYQFSGEVARLAGEEVSPAVQVSDEYEDGSPAAEIVERIVAQALRERASDVHIEPGDTKTRVRFRIDGHLFNALEMPLASHPSVTARVKLMAGMDIAEKRTPQDGRIHRAFEGRDYDLRVSTLPSIRGEKTVLRILDGDREAMTLDALGCSPAEMAAIRRLLSGRRGLILNTGPIGSGKTTTLHAMMRELKTDEFNAITIEDPVEYRLPQATQVQVNEKSGLTFASALRAVLRQDMDLLLLGEIRDQETAALAVRAAITGHLILTTLHCGEAAAAPARMVDMGVPPYLLGACLRGVLSQRLLRRLCPHCRRAVTGDAAELRALGLTQGTMVYQAVGCPQCGGRGYHGRIAAFEILSISPALAQSIVRGATAAEIASQAQAEGMVPLRQNAASLVQQGVTSCEEALASLGE
ncbi:MAG: type II/IV secretion system protein [Pyramidobacter sp.]|nr:type II/IV secretion system protein [Pyramidobacter sp.]